MEQVQQVTVSSTNENEVRQTGIPFRFVRFQRTSPGSGGTDGSGSSKYRVIRKTTGHLQDPYLRTGEHVNMSQNTQTRMLQPSQTQGTDNRPTETQITINVNGVPVTPLQRVFIQRDYRLGVAIRFMNEFPIELSGRIDPNAFDYTLKEINAIFQEAEQFTCTAFCESCLGFITANLYWFCRDSRYEKVLTVTQKLTALKRISKFIAEQNQCVYLPNSLYLTDPVVRGLRCIEISVIGDQLQRS